LSDGPTPSLRRELGGLHATGIVLGAIIGVGIFLTPSKVAAQAGSPELALALWAIGGLIAMAGALCMAEVGARYPTSGGEIMALKHMIGRLPAFLYGWSLLTAIQTGVLVIIALFGAHNLGVLLGQEWGPTESAAAASAAIVGLAVLNLMGVRYGAWAQTLTSIFKVVVLAALAVLGVWALFDGLTPADALPATNEIATENQVAGPSLTVFLAGIAATLFSYGGFHQVTWVGGEVRDPQRTVPRAIVLGVLMVVACYLAANWAYFSLLPFEQVTGSKSLAADAVGTRLPDVARRLTALALCVSAFGIANAQLLTTPRVYYSLAKEGLFPRILGELHHQSGVPRAAIILQTVLAVALLWLAGGDRMDQLVTGVVFVDWVFHILAVGGLFLVRRRGEAAPEYRTPWWPLPPLIFLVGAVVGLGATFLDPDVRQASLLGVAWIAVGMVVYAVQARLAKTTR
jgi:APA family basic amino acid/polyamine antiporter